MNKQFNDFCDAMRSHYEFEMSMAKTCVTDNDCINVNGLNNLPHETAGVNKNYNITLLKTLWDDYRSLCNIQKMKASSNVTINSRCEENFKCT